MLKAAHLLSYVTPLQQHTTPRTSPQAFLIFFACAWAVTAALNGLLGKVHLAGVVPTAAAGPGGRLAAATVTLALAPRRGVVGTIALALRAALGVAGPGGTEGGTSARRATREHVTTA